MKRLALILIVLTLALAGVVLIQPTRSRGADPKPPTAAWQVFFSPKGGCTASVVQQLDGAMASVLVQAYSFTSAPIAKALTDAHKRGVDVRVILDKSNDTAQYSAATFLLHAGIPTFIDAEHAIAHNKVMVIDGETVITGSFNFTKAAEEGNAENLLVLQSAELAARYTENWQDHLTHSAPYKDKAAAATPSAGATNDPAPAGGTVRYIGNKNSHIFHLPACASLPAPENRVPFTSREAAVNTGYTPCKRCKP
ncbi:MAG: phospholipase D-like domain-containing protein [Armatimonadota bacterium]